MKLQPYIFPQKETNKKRDICFHIKHLTDWKSRRIKKLLETNDDKCRDGPVLLLGACWQTCIICQEIRQQSFFSSTSSKQSSGAILSNVHSTRLFTLEAGTLNYGWGQDKPQYFFLNHILFVPSIHCNKGEWRVQLFWWHVILSWQLHMSQVFLGGFFCPMVLSLFKNNFNQVSNLAKLSRDVCYTLTHVLLHTAMPLSSKTL